MIRQVSYNNKHIYGFDFLRCLAILAILFFHIDQGTFSGGFLGVDLFLLLTGYLVASSAFETLGEKPSLTTLKNNLLKRAKRILTPLIFLVLIVLIYMLIFNRSLFLLSISDGIASIFNVGNWWFIIKKVDYFNSFNTSPFKHLWYLGVTEQFFLIFTIAIYLIKKSTSSIHHRRKYAQIFFLITIVISLCLHLFIYDIDKISRVYYGTDTRLFTPMLGALLASLVPKASLLKAVDGKYKKNLTIMAGLSLLIYLVLMAMLSEYSLGLYKGGFFAIALLAALLVISVGKNGSALNFAYKNRIVQMISSHSYSLYLWHFPVLVLTKLPSEVSQPNLFFVLIRIAVIALLTKFSYDWLEKKSNRLLTNSIFTKERLLYYTKDKRFRKSFISFSLGLIIMATFSVANNATKEEQNQEIPIYEQTKNLVVTRETEETQPIDESSILTDDKNSSLPNADELNLDSHRQLLNKLAILATSSSAPDHIVESNVEEAPSEQTLDETIEQSSDATVEQAPEENLEEIPTTVPYDTVILIGDSLTLGVSGTMQARIPQLIADGEVGRQLYQSQDIAWSYAHYDSSSTAIVYQLGTNGIFEEHHLDALVEPFPNSDIFFINTKVPKEWEKSVNEALASYVNKHPQYKLIDWYTVAGSDPDYLADDLTHVNSSGILAFADLMMKSLNGQ